MGFVSALLFLVGLFSFFNKKKYITLIVIVLLSSNYFQLVDVNTLIGSISIQNGDFALLLIFSLLPFRIKLKNSELNGIRNALTFFFLFLAISIFFDFIMRDSTAIQIFRTNRKTGYLAFFFLINSFSWQDYQKLIKTILALTAIHALLYISQYITGYSFSSKDVMENEFGTSRYSNIPTYIIPIFVYSVFKNTGIKFRTLLIILFLFTILLSQTRGLIISAISVLLLFQVLQNKIKLQTLLTFSLLAIVGYNIVLNFMPIIAERFQHLNEEVTMTNEMNFDDLNSFFHEGSFIFRLGLTYERLMYVLEDFSRIIMGVGFVPDIDITTPIFILGTYSEALPTGFEQYNSVDIFFPNIITRYGIVGSIIFLYLIFKLFNFSFKTRKFLWGKILFTYLWSMIFISFINESFYNGQYFIFIFIMLGFIISEKKYVDKFIKNK